MVETVKDQEVQDEVSEEVEDIVEDSPEDLGGGETDDGETNSEDDEDTPKLPWDEVEPEEELESGKAEKGLLRTVMKQKGKLKELRSEKDSEIENLREQIESLKGSINTRADTNTLKRPRYPDFDSDDEYDEAMDKYEIAKEEEQYKRLTQSTTKNDQQEKFNRRIEEGVDGHWERAEKFVEKHKIDVDVYKEADKKVRNAVEAVTPNLGDANVNFLISNLGEGSEAVMMYLGTNETQLAKLQSLIIEDPQGHKASTFLGKVQERIKPNKKRTSQAPKPAKDIKGDKAPNKYAKALKKRYEEAEKSGNGQLVYNIRKEARASGIDLN